MTDRQQGQSLKELRKQRGISVKFVATTLGVGSSYVCMLESGKKRWSQDRVRQYLDAIMPDETRAAVRHVDALGLDRKRAMVEKLIGFPKPYSEKELREANKVSVSIPTAPNGKRKRWEKILAKEFSKNL